MRRMLWMLLVLVAASALAQTPKAAVQGFIEAWNRRDLKGAMKFVHGGTLNEQNFKELIRGQEWPVFSLTNLSESVSGNSATVTMTIGVSRDPHPMHDSVHLTNVAGAWLIEPAKQMPHSEEAPMVESLAFLLGNPTPVLAQAREAARKTACLSNLKQVALAALMVTTDHDDVFKFTVKNAKEKLYPYTKNTAIFTCPLDAKGTMSYSFNPRVLNIPNAKIQNPALTVLAYEGKDGKLNFRHAGKANVAFCDGHVKSLSPAEAKNLRWKP